MRVLVAIANHGTKNRPYLERVLAAYRAMPFDVDVVVHADAPREYGPDVEVRVGAPTANPRSLPFAHRSLFAERACDYDLYVYSEDDTLVEARHLEAFRAVDALLADDEVPGFLRYEEHPDGERSYCSIHSAYHWDPGSVRRAGGELLAGFTNQHAACYVLTRAQLGQALVSGGFLVEPHEGLYDMLVSAATDPYVRCGLTRLVCVSRVEDFLLHHLPDVYLGTLGIGPADFAAQLEALEGIADGRLGAGRLFETETGLDTAVWNRFYHPRPAPDLRALAGGAAEGVLSVGCGDGVLERALFPDARRLVGIPLDEVIGAVARRRGIETLPPSFDAAFAALEGERFDRVLCYDVLGHVPDPVRLLERLRPLLTTGGELVATVPNHRHHGLRRRLRQGAPPVPSAGFAAEGVHVTDRGVLTGWLAAAGYDVAGVGYRYGSRLAGLASRAPAAAGGLLGRTVVARAVARSTPRPAARRGAAAGDRAVGDRRVDRAAEDRPARA